VTILMLDSPPIQRYGRTFGSIATTVMRFEGWTQGRRMPSQHHIFVDWALLAMESPLAAALQIRECL
jgi:hypothetical protein